MAKKIKVGLLPLYIALYDRTNPTLRPALQGFYDSVAEGLENEGLEVIRTPFCCVKEEFDPAVKSYTDAGADVIVTLHMAYSPSLESIGALTSSPLPIVVIDTTEDFVFNGYTNPARISFDHGIHGVMDMCSMLRRSGKIYAIAAGHPMNSDVFARTAGFCRAAVAAAALKGSKVGTIGGSFDGMGDFLVTAEELLDRFGVTLVESTKEKLEAIGAKITDADVNAELGAYRARFSISPKMEDKLFYESAKASLVVRRWIEEEGLSAFTVNFLGVGPKSGLYSMPFVESCLAMERGTGYAGEGDSLTAAFCGAVLSAFEETSFVEIFCPGWSTDTLLLSHMGEMNYRVIDMKPELTPCSTNYTEGYMPISGPARLKAGKATFMNVYRNENGFSLFLSPVEMFTPVREGFTGDMRGFMKPSMPLPEFLEAISTAGATHHSILVYGATVEQLDFFGRLLGLPVVKACGCGK